MAGKRDVVRRRAVAVIPLLFARQPGAGAFVVAGLAGHGADSYARTFLKINDVRPLPLRTCAPFSLPHIVNQWRVDLA